MSQHKHAGTVALAVAEATGKPHQLARRMLSAAGYWVAPVNRAPPRKFAEAIGQL